MIKNSSSACPVRNLISNGIKENFAIELTDLQLNQFVDFLTELQQWNKVINLTAITDEKEIVLKHFLDSLSILTTYNLRLTTNNLIDVGTGAGLPGIPLKICFPQLQVTLLDSTKKKCAFLDHIVKKLGLDNVKIIWSRAEELAKDKTYREQYDFVVARAVSNLATLTELCLPYTKIGGLFIAYKGLDIDTEVDQAKKAIKLLGGELQEISTIEYKLFDLKETKKLVIIKKFSPTPAEYPRRAGIPQKNPII